MKNDNLYALLEAHFPRDVGAPCLRTADGLVYSWRDLQYGSARMAGWLRSLQLTPDADGAPPRVAVQVEKSPEALMLYLATLRAGLVFVPLNTAYQRAELEHFLRDAAPAVFVCAPEREEELRPLAQAAGVAHVATLGEARNGSLLAAAAPFPDTFDTVPRAASDLAAILYTSGTTGRSKGAMLSHGNLAANALVLDEFWGFKEEREAGGHDVLLHALPLFHVHGLFVASHAALLAGAQMIFLRKFDAREVIKWLPQATVFMGVPTYYTRLLAEPGFDRHVCRNMRLFISGSAPLLPETHKAFYRRTGHVILERYGMSETVMLVSNPYFGIAVRDRIAGTVGVPLPGVSVRVVKEDGTPCAVGEIGQVEVKGPSVFSGYWRMPEKTAEDFTPDGYFKTGDVGHFGGPGRPDNYLTLVGRAKDLIISGGYNVYPKEIEGYIDQMEGVAESAVIGLPHPDFGEAVAAVVVGKPGAELQEAQIIARLKQTIANYKVPKRVFVVDELPRNAMGKVQKNVLRERYAKTFAA
ncbi:MAG: malonyl-CoA synthase [Sutterellaceae bacterium]|nr:malonyl-CoA synthase [Burkholderiaceae bacterium]MDW8430182.1 malonyl-CoA synthase [Sutterellaceae bacterium]